MTQMSTNKRMHKSMTLYSYNKILFSAKKQGIDVFNTHKSQIYYIKHNKLTQKNIYCMIPFVKAQPTHQTQLG